MQRLRRTLLSNVLNNTTDVQGLAFYQALAQQTFINEYIYDVDEAEEKQLRALEDKLSTAFSCNEDVSPVELAVVGMYVQRQTQKTTADNITYAQADIMKLGEIDMSFDLIESVGVLHHMETPELGWRVLTDLLRPGGLMKIGLYSELARKAVVKGRELIAVRGYQSTPGDIRKARQEIIDSNNTDFSSLLDLTDFYQLSECRDLLFHVQEHRYSLPQIQNILDKLGLTFLGFDLKSANVTTQFQTEHPQVDALSDLAAWHDFEAEHPRYLQGHVSVLVPKKSGLRP